MWNNDSYMAVNPQLSIGQAVIANGPGLCLHRRPLPWGQEHDFEHGSWDQGQVFLPRPLLPPLTADQVQDVYKLDWSPVESQDRPCCRRHTYSSVLRVSTTTTQHQHCIAAVASERQGHKTLQASDIAGLDSLLISLWQQSWGTRWMWPVWWNLGCEAKRRLGRRGNMLSWWLWDCRRGYASSWWRRW